MWLLIVVLFCFQVGHTATDSNLATYFSYVQELGQLKGDHRKGEIEVVLDPLDIAQIEKMQEKRLIKKGFSLEQAVEFSRVGLIAEDQYLIWLRDAVYFPKGIPGTYDRLIWKRPSFAVPSGVAVLPVLPSGKIVLNLNYRHATRSWELELPRGGMQPKESETEAAMRELREETGLEVASLTFLGRMAPDSGILASVIPVFMGEVSTQGQSNQEYSEAIVDVVAFTLQELKEGLLKGSLEVHLNGQKEQIPLRDSFLAFAILQAEFRQLL